MKRETLKQTLDQALAHTEANLLIGILFDDGSYGIFPHWEFDAEDLDATLIMTAALAVDKHGEGSCIVAYAFRPE